MLVSFLTKSNAFILGPIAFVLGLIMNAIYNFFHLFGIQNIALTIFVFTFITKAIMLPFTIKQQKFQKLSSRMNPELQKIQAKYKGKRDEASIRKMQAEQQAVYQKYGANPTSGCLPLLITLPIMFALYQVIYNIPAYVSQVKDLYEGIANTIISQPQYADVLTKIAHEGFRMKSTDFTTTNHVIDLLSQFRTQQWNEIQASLPGIKDAVAQALPAIHRVNNFFGLNITNLPGLTFPAILIPIIATVLQFIQGKQMQVKQDNKDNPAASAMNSMNYIMPIMSFFFCIMLPIGVGLYWIASSVFQIIQQYMVNKYMDRIDVEELIQKSVTKANKKRAAAIGRGGTSLQELAKKQTKSIETTYSEPIKVTEKVEDTEDTDDSKESSDDVGNKNRASNSPNSITEIANLLKNRNGEKGDK